jgi:hypothetical protein
LGKRKRIKPLRPVAPYEAPKERKKRTNAAAPPAAPSGNPLAPGLSQAPGGFGIQLESRHYLRSPLSFKSKRDKRREKRRINQPPQPPRK